MKYCILYNPFSGNGHGRIYAEKLNNILVNDELMYQSMPEIENFKNFLKKNENIIICGGDGTINYFCNHTYNIKHNSRIYYYSTGSGNDFYNDIGNKQNYPFEITDYLKHLPILKIEKQEKVFINGVGLGIDGYCCETVDKLKKLKGKKANYKSAAIKGLLYGYKPQNAIVKVDGKKYIFKNVWLAPTMYGRYYGGGMMIAPNQDRNNKDKKVSLIIVNEISNIKCLLLFSSIFKGTHIKNKAVHVLEGNNIKVEFEKPCALQIDGEVIYDVKKYQVISK